MFIGLKDYSERRDSDRSSDAIANKLRMRFAAEIPDAQVAVFGPPAVRGAGRAGGFAVMIEDREDAGPAALQREIDNMVRNGAQTPGLLMLFSVFRANVPQLQIDPDSGACMMRGVGLADFADTLAVYEGSVYCNDFNLFGRTWQVVVQAEPEFRLQPEDLPRLCVRNSRGAMVPVGSLAGQREVNGPLILSRYNMYPAASINGQAAPGVSSGQAIDLIERLAHRELSRSMAFEWTDMSYLEQVAGTTAMEIFGYAIAMVFLMLAAQYESWALPLAVILVVPMCLLSALAGVDLARMDMNIFTQVGFVVLVGLASKNAILIVEFAKQQRLGGKPRREATLEACHLRLRPIVMTSLAFILGVVPLISSHGAGAEMRRTLGTAVFSGMLGVTIFGLVLTPVFFYTIDRLGDWHLFRSGPVRAVGGFALDILRLGFIVRPLHRAARRFAGSAPAGRPHEHNGAESHPRTSAASGEKEPATVTKD
jgi:multidrug efflux pump